jgi:dipeptidyl aminopeptidase/acylaminoacyl peptidase
MSFGAFTDSSALRIGVETDYNAGAVVVAAAGNENTSNPLYPAAYPEAIAVAATDSSDNRAVGNGWASNYGDWVEVAAPGVNILTTSLGGGFAYASGTSLATPFVSGLAGLILSKNPSLSNVEVRNIIDSTTDPVYGFPAIQHGRINAFQALLNTPRLNSAPLITGTNSPVIVNEGEMVQIIVNAFDPDGDPLTYYINDSRFDVNGNTFTWLTDFNDAGNYSFTVTVSDGDLNDTAVVDVEVINVNRPPQIVFFSPANDEVISVIKGTTVEFFENSIDPDADPLTFSWKLDGVEMANTQNWSHSFIWPGQHTVEFTVTDVNGASDAVSWTLFVFKPLDLGYWIKEAGFRENS